MHLAPALWLANAETLSTYGKESQQQHEGSPKMENVKCNSVLKRLTSCLLTKQMSRKRPVNLDIPGPL